MASRFIAPPIISINSRRRDKRRRPLLPHLIGKGALRFRHHIPIYTKKQKKNQRNSPKVQDYRSRDEIAFRDDYREKIRFFFRSPLTVLE